MALDPKQGFQKGHKVFKGTEKTRFKKGDKRLIGNKFNIGKIPWNKNKPGYCLNISEKRRKQLKEQMQGNKFSTGRKPTIETKRKQSEALRGNRSYLWEGGKSNLRTLIRNCFKYRQWRSDIFTRDDFTCQNCGERGGKLEADHFPKSYSAIIEGNKIKTTDNYLIHKKYVT